MGYELNPLSRGRRPEWGLSMQMRHTCGQIRILAYLPCRHRRQRIPNLLMLHHHIPHLALLLEAAHRFEQQLAHFDGIVLPGGLFKLTQQPLDIALRQHLLLGAHDA